MEIQTTTKRQKEPISDEDSSDQKTLKKQKSILVYKQDKVVAIGI